MGIEEVRGLVGDIGATNARFAFIGADGAPFGFRAYEVAEHPTLASAIKTFLIDAGAPSLGGAALAVAAPVQGDRISFTNLPWSFSIDALRRDLSLERLRVLNDFTANARAIPMLRETDRAPIGGGAAVPGAPAVILGPGSGLGVSALIPCPAGGDVALEGEGGHATLAASNAREAAVVAVLRERFGHVSAERALSGPGLVNLYGAICALSGQTPSDRTPVEVASAGVGEDDPLARELVEMFCAMLGGFAGNLALSLGARGGVYIAGGIAPKMLDFLRASDFRGAFEAKGRFAGYLSEIPTFVVTHDSPALLGAASLLKDTA